MGDQTEALTALSPASPSRFPQRRMTPISERESKEVEARAATSRDAPTPCATRDEKAAVKSSEQEKQAARRDLLAGIRKLIKSFRGLSHIFEMYKEGDEDEDMSIEIGFPTDVQHVAHIGLDGSSNVSGLGGLEGARELLSLSNLTLEQQFEFAMASLAAHKDHNVVVHRVAPN